MAATKKKAKKVRARDPKHDEGYKYILSKVADFLHFLRKYFNVPWIEGVTVDDIEPVNKSYITKEYRRVDSDLIYKLRKGDTDIYFYVLLELQSRVDNTMVFRLLRYMVELLNDIFQNTDKKVRRRKDFRLPAIVPIVLYDGDRSWTAAKSFKDYTKGHELFGDSIIDFRYLLFDLNRTDDENILPVATLLDAAFSVMKMRLKKRLSPKEIDAWWSEQTRNLSKDDVLKLFDWMTLAFRAPPETTKMIQDPLTKGDVVAMKNVFELIADDWRKESKREGKREGILVGKREKALEIADNLMAKGMSIGDVVDATGLTVEEILQR